jgi:hypothetical protein
VYLSRASCLSTRRILREVRPFPVFLRWPLLGWHQSRFSILVGGDEGKYCLCNLVPYLIGPASPPGLHSDRHRCSTDFHNMGVKTDFIPDENRLMKNHSVHGNSCATAATPAASGICRRKVHLRHQPAAKNVSRGIGIRGHGNRADQRFKCGWMVRIGHMLAED